jgi:hypothetical protein
MVEKSRRLIAALTKAHEAVTQAHDWEPAAPSEAATTADLPAGA